jgi:uracil-DNA glycosylase family 4
MAYTRRKKPEGECVIDYCRHQADSKNKLHCQQCFEKWVIGKKPETCVGCPLYEYGEGFVWGEGPQRAQMMAIGEAPGEEEARGSRPFIGGSGRVFNAQLKQAEINRSEIYVTNCVKCRPPHNRQPDDDEIRHCAQYLVQEIKEVNPNLLLALGSTPLYVTTGDTRIGVYRGVPLEGPGGRKVLATFHPAFIMRQQHYWVAGIHDLLKAKKQATFPEIIRIPVEYTSPADPASTGDALYAEAVAAGYIIYDLETTGLSRFRDTVKCIGLGTRPGRAACYYWTHATQNLVRRILEDPRIAKVGQNSEHFDQPFLEEKGFNFIGPHFDTLHMFHLLNSELPKSLATIATFYTDMPYWKDEGKSYGKKQVTMEELMHYCCKDIDGTARAFFEMKGEIKALDMEQLLQTVMDLQPVLRNMTNRGLKKDEDKAMLWAVLMGQKADEWLEKLRTAVGDPTLNVNSPKEVMHLLYDKMGLPTQWKKDRNKGMRPTADADAISALVEKFPENGILNLVSEIRSAWHSISTNLEVEADENGFVHPSIGSAKAATGRLNSWDPNGQNIPTELREIYVPDTPDHVFLSSDWSQIEWRLAMALAGDKTGLELLNSGGDIHTAIAAETLGMPVHRVAEEQRYASKFIVYGLGYGRGADSIAKQLKMDKGKVDAFIERYFGRFERYAEYRKELEVQVEKHNYLKTPFNRRRWWYTRQVTEMYNFPMQATAADMMYIALIELERNLPVGATLRLTVHDEVIICCHKSVVALAWQCIMDVMNRTWPEIIEGSARPEIVKHYYPQGFIVPADISIGMDNWRQTKDKKYKKLQADWRKQLGVTA